MISSAKAANMIEEASLKFRLNKSEEIRSYLLDEIKHNDLMGEKRKKTINIATEKTNTIIATNFTNTHSINCHSRKVRDCYILHTVLLVIILQLMIIIIYYYGKQKMYNIKRKIMI